MENEVVPVEVKGLVPTTAGVAVFLGNEEKVFVIYVDQSVGSAIGMFMNKVSKERPLTHDLMAMLMQAVGAKMERAIINDFQGGTYFARLILSAENEIEQKKIIELDARPSDCIAMATQQSAPLYVSKAVWDDAEDMTGVLEQMSREIEEQDDQEET